MIDAVVGYDVAPSMLAVAREVAPANVTLTTEFPHGPFDWINSYIVFQHIPPAEGLVLIDRCLAATAPGAFLSLQFIGWREGKQPSRALHAVAARWLERKMHRRADSLRGPAYPDVRLRFQRNPAALRAHGFERVRYAPHEHGGHHGAWFISRRSG